MEEKCNIRREKEAKIVVLMSTYNGEAYIQEQLESILSQTYSDVKIYVRDDDSKDHSLEILRQYEKENKIVLLKGKNKGFIGSFFSLLKECEDAEYYAWCDQDDIWLPDKLARAVELLKKEAEEIPVLYFSDYDYYDQNMNFQKHGLDHKRGPSFANSLMDCISLGFNSVFNDKARKMMLEKLPEHSCGHDWWTYMVCAAFGKVIYDRGYVSVKYRRLEASVSPGGKSFLVTQIWRFKKFFLNDYFQKIREQLYEFGTLYGTSLKGKDQKVINLFIQQKYSFFKALKKCFYPVWFRQGIVEEIMVRALFLIGRL